MNEDEKPKLILKEEEPDTLKIFYASRTHSQLTQFIHELKKTEFSVHSDDLDDLGIRTVSLGSRSNLCIHEKVQELKLKPAGHTRMNEACIDMQKKGLSEAAKCEYFHSAHAEDYVMRSLSEVHDIEELADLGEKMAVCPYYGTRSAVRKSQVFLVTNNSS